MCLSFGVQKDDGKVCGARTFGELRAHVGGLRVLRDLAYERDDDPIPGDDECLCTLDVMFTAAANRMALRLDYEFGHEAIFVPVLPC